MPIIFTTQFFWIALLAGTLLGLVAPLIGMFLVVRRYSPLSDTLAHVSLVGVVAGFFIGLPPILGAWLTGFLSAVGIEKLRQQRRVFGESLLVIFLSGSLGLVTVLLKFVPSSGAYLDSYLFGNINSLSYLDLNLILFVVFLVVTVVSLFYRQFFLISFDEELAKLSGLNISFWNMIFMGLAALVISISISSVGVLLISSLLIVPVVSALQFKKGFKHSMVLSLVFGVCSVWLGILSSYLLDLSTGGMIVIMNLFIFTFSLIWRS
jgi:zinc transport system permease protein